MFRPLDEFAGWLRFFYFIVIMNIAFHFVSGITLIEELIKQPDKILTLGTIAQWAFTISMFLIIIKIIQQRNPEVPENIKEYLFYIFVVAILHGLFYTVVTILIFKREWSTENTMAFTSAVQNMIWATVWRSYFERSKRVKAYYLINKKDVDILA